MMCLTFSSSQHLHLILDYVHELLLAGFFLDVFDICWYPFPKISAIRPISSEWWLVFFWGFQYIPMFTVNYGKITKAATWSRKEHAVRSAEMRQRNHSKRRWHSHKNLGQKDLGNINQFDHLTCLTWYMIKIDFISCSKSLLRVTSPRLGPANVDELRAFQLWTWLQVEQPVERLQPPWWSAENGDTTYGTYGVLLLDTTCIYLPFFPQLVAADLLLAIMTWNFLKLRSAPKLSKSQWLWVGPEWSIEFQRFLQHGMHQLFATGRSLRKALACLGTSALLNVPQQFQAGAAWNILESLPGFLHVSWCFVGGFGGLMWIGYFQCSICSIILWKMCIERMITRAHPRSSTSFSFSHLLTQPKLPTDWQTHRISQDLTGKILDSLDMFSIPLHLWRPFCWLLLHPGWTNCSEWNGNWDQVPKQETHWKILKVETSSESMENSRVLCVTSLPSTL